MVFQACLRSAASLQHTWQCKRHSIGYKDGQDRLSIASAYIAQFYREGIMRFLNAARQYGFSGPAIVGIALLNIGNYHLGIGVDFFHQFARSDRDNLILPEVWVENIESTVGVDSFFRPMLDILWQGFGQLSCPYFDKDGGFSAPR